MLFAKLYNFFVPRKNPNSNLGLHGDLDDVELLEEVERSLSISLNDQEAEAIKNVGDFYELAKIKCREKEQALSWEGFLRIIQPHSELPVGEIRKDTEFFRHL